VLTVRDDNPKRREKKMATKEASDKERIIELLALLMNKFEIKPQDFIDALNKKRAKRE
jgi:hypothetical protein